MTCGRPAGYAVGALRIVIGRTFLWACFGKLLVLGFGTGHHEAAPSTASAMPPGWAFMLGLPAIGIALTVGVFERLGTVGGVVMHVPTWTTRCGRHFPARGGAGPPSPALLTGRR